MRVSSPSRSNLGSFLRALRPVFFFLPLPLREEIARSSEGSWQEEVLFEPQQPVDRCDFSYAQMTECDARLKRYLAEMPSRERTQLEKGTGLDSRISHLRQFVRIALSH
jgi:hypothetical protein